MPATLLDSSALPLPGPNLRLLLLQRQLSPPRAHRPPLQPCSSFNLHAGLFPLRLMSVTSSGHGPDPRGHSFPTGQSLPTTPSLSSVLAPPRPPGKSPRAASPKQMPGKSSLPPSPSHAGGRGAGPHSSAHSPPSPVTHLRPLISSQGASTPPRSRLLPDKGSHTRGGVRDLGRPEMGVWAPARVSCLT